MQNFIKFKRHNVNFIKFKLSMELYKVHPFSQVPAAATENRVRERAAGFSRWSVFIAGIAVTSPGPEYTTVSTLIFKASLHAGTTCTY